MNRMSDAPAQRLAHKIARLAADAADVTAFRSAVNDHVKRVIGWDFAIWSTVDPATTLFTSCRPFGIAADPENERKLFELEFAGGDANLFTDLARSDRPARSLHEATGGDLESSRRYRELLQPTGCGDELRAVFNEGTATWGALVALRGLSSRPFADADAAVVSTLGPLVARGLRHCLLRTAAEAPRRLVDGPGLLLLAGDGRVLETTPTAERWRSLLEPSTWLTAVQAVAGKAKADGGLVSLPVWTQTGHCIVLHGSATASGGVAIIVEEARALQLTSTIANLYGLTPRERALTELVLQGKSTKEISQALEISSYTVQDHLKSVFDKVGVRSRRDLVSMFFHGHYVERRRAGSDPSPYGWYLDDCTPTENRG